MNVPVYLLTFAQLICAAAGAEHVSLERQIVEEGISSGRRTCRLYCRVGIGFHLQIHPDGRVNGSHEPNQLSKSLGAWSSLTTKLWTSDFRMNAVSPAENAHLILHSCICSNWSPLSTQLYLIQMASLKVKNNKDSHRKSLWTELLNLGSLTLWNIWAVIWLTSLVCVSRDVGR